MTCGSGRRKRLAKERNCAAVSFCARITSTWPPKNAFHSGLKASPDSGCARSMPRASRPNASPSFLNSMHSKKLLHARAREAGVGEQAGRVGQAKDLGKVKDAARALLAADHDEVILVAVQPRHEDDARLVEARRRLEDVAGERNARAEHFVKVLIFVTA